MGYAVLVKGALDFDPPLGFVGTTGLREVLRRHPEAAYDLRLRERVVERTTPEGLLSVVTCEGIDAVGGDDSRGRIGAGLDALLAVVPPETAVTGQITLEGEEVGDMARYRPEESLPGLLAAQGNRWLAVHETATMRWPDGEEV